MMKKSKYKFGLLDKDYNVIDAFRAYDVEEAREFFILMHGLSFVSQHTVSVVQLLYCHPDGTVNIKSYFD